jgi:hypothetical protein
MTFNPSEHEPTTHCTATDKYVYIKYPADTGPIADGYYSTAPEEWDAIPVKAGG